MRGPTVHLFDELIEGTTSTWHTSERFIDVLRSGDAFAFQAVTSVVSGTSPTLTVHAEYSEDAENWYRVTPLLDAVTIANDGAYGASESGILLVPTSFMRCAIELGGTAPACRLKLFMTVRSRTSGPASVAGRRRGAS